MNYEKIGQFLKELREEKKLSQYQLADEIKMSRTLITKIESGKASVTLPNIMLFCDFYGITINELLAGERKTGRNDVVFDKVAYNILDENNKLRSTIKIVLLLILILILAFFIYFFVTTYNSTLVYTINSSNDSLIVKNGLIVKTRDKIYIRLEPKLLENENNFSSISLFYILGDEVKEIYNSSELSLISINDFFGTQEFFDFKKFDDIKNNIYINVNKINGEEITIKLSAEKDYINSNLFVFKNMDKNKGFDTDKKNKNEMVDKILKKYNETTLNVTYKKKKYEIIVLDSLIRVNYKENDKTIEYCYDNLSSIYFSKNLNDKEIYKYLITQNECIVGKCDSLLDDYDLFMSLLEELNN